MHGAAGRMGQRLVTLISQDKDASVGAAIEMPGHPRIGHDAGEIAGIGTIGVPVADTLRKKTDAVIDFSTAAAVGRIIAGCVSHQVPLVLATTGLSSQQEQTVREASKTIPLLWSPNTGLAVNVAIKLAQVAAQSLAGQHVDVEILERHHRYKVDAPSGTALKFGEIIAHAMGQTTHRHGREGVTGQRPAGEIGYHAISVGDNPGEHTIVFGMLGELIEITVRVTNRDCYAFGAIAAAKFLANRTPGLYAMNDVLGIDDRGDEPV
ncbi:MAG: 4-hydroxy-tetrahydrodipicolinate reductase [Planctomycetaceae bacterium]|nr:4-hydroxy-tetrahydrodipicolinate reductase [Planctomycetaceae bacterium]